MDDILKRLGVLESSMGETRADVSAIKAALPHLATAAALREVEGTLKAQIAESRGSLEAKIHAMETRTIQWFIGTAIALVAAVFGIARYLA